MRKAEPEARRTEEQGEGWKGVAATGQPGAVGVFAKQRTYRHDPQKIEYLMRLIKIFDDFKYQHDIEIEFSDEVEVDIGRKDAGL